MVIYTRFFLASSNWLSLGLVRVGPTRQCVRVTPGRADVLLSPAPIHMSPLRRETGGEVRRCNWITEGTPQCGKRKREEIRSLDGQVERVKRDKRRQRDRKSKGDPTPQSQRRDQQLDPAAESELCRSCQRPTVPLETLGCFLSPFLSPFHFPHTLSLKLKQCGGLPHLQQTV